MAYKSPVGLLYFMKFLLIVINYILVNIHVCMYIFIHTYFLCAHLTMWDMLKK